MIVAWDARKLRDGGIGSYVRHTLAALAADPGLHAYAALLDPREVGREPWPGALREEGVRAANYGLAEHWKVAAAARAVAADLLHAPHYTLPLGWTGPAVVTIHDLIHVRFARFFPPGASIYALGMASLGARRARHVITDSEHVRRDVIELLGVNEDKVTAIPLAASPAMAPRADDAVRAFLAERGLPTGYLLYVGARKRHKNLELLLEALARIPRADRPPLVLAGRPWGGDDRLAALTIRLGLDRHVRFSGPIADDESLARLYSGATLYVQPSLAEGFGLPPLEAMACGVPVLSSSAGSLPEVVGDAAEVLAPVQAEAWGATIRELLGDGERLAALRARGLERAGRFRWSDTATRTRAIYDRVANGR